MQLQCGETHRQWTTAASASADLLRSAIPSCCAHNAPLTEVWEGKSTRPHRANGTIIGDSWPRNPCNEVVQSIRLNRSFYCYHHAQTARVDLGREGAKTSFLLYLNSPACSCHRSADVIQTWIMLACKSCRSIFPSSLTSWRFGEQRDVQCAVLCATGRTSLGHSVMGNRVRVHCFSRGERICGWHGTQTQQLRGQCREGGEGDLDEGGGTGALCGTFPLVKRTLALQPMTKRFINK